MKNYDVLGLGSVAVDDLLYVESYPAADVKMQVRRRERQCGGLTATALVAAARQGACCAYGGVLGHDEDSAYVMACFEREGIDTRHIVRRPDARPIHATIIVDETRHTRNIFFDLKGSVGADPSFPSEELIASSRTLLVDHYGIEGMIRAARMARVQGVPVVADLERDEWPGFHDLLALVDHLVVSQAFARRLTGQANPEKACTELWRPDRQVVVVTCGENGCWSLIQDGAPQHFPAFPVTVKDTTGCGDVFHGVYAVALAKGLALEDRIRLASAAAAIKASHRGGQAGIPREGEVESFLETKL